MLTAITLTTILPNIPQRIRATVAKNLNDLAMPAGIDTPNRMAAFLSQVGHESGSFRYVREIASGRAYEGRKDLGNVIPGDGMKYKGRGYIQVTGRTNYRACSLALFGDNRLVAMPQMLESPENAMLSALWFWNSRSLSIYADKPDNWSTVIRKGTSREQVLRKLGYITFRINGGLNGLADRLEIYNRARESLGLPVYK